MQSDTDTRRDVDVITRQGEFGFECCLKAFTNFYRVFVFLQLAEQERELVTSPICDCVSFTHAACQSFRDIANEIIGTCRSERFANILEPIDRDKKHSNQIVLTPGS